MKTENPTGKTINRVLICPTCKKEWVLRWGVMANESMFRHMKTEHKQNLKWYNGCMNKTKCFFCDKEAIYYDVVVDNQEYIVADVCAKHNSVEFVSQSYLLTPK